MKRRGSTVILKYALGWIVIALILLFCFTMTGCKTVKEIQYETITEIVHDTTEITVHDTTKITDIRYDSIDRYVEKIKYVDSNGVWHEKEIEHLNHYVTIQKEEYQATIKDLKSKIESLNKQLEEKETIKYIEKPLKTWQKNLMWSGAFLWLLVIVGIVGYIIYRRKK